MLSGSFCVELIVLAELFHYHHCSRFHPPQKHHHSTLKIWLLNILVININIIFFHYHHRHHHHSHQHHGHHRHDGHHHHNFELIVSAGPLSIVKLLL